MNREIKFRIWLKEKKQMIQDVHICPEYGWLVMSDNDALEEICGRISFLITTPQILTHTYNKTKTF